MRRVYIDEAGDRGTTVGSSYHFVVSALIVDDHKDAMARRELLQLKQALGRKPTDTLHFRKLTHSQKVKACQEIATFSVQCSVSVVLCKRSISTPFPDGGLAYISQPDPMYLWAIRLLLERVSGSFETPAAVHVRSRSPTSSASRQASCTVIAKGSCTRPQASIGLPSPDTDSVSMHRMPSPCSKRETSAHQQYSGRWRPINMAIVSHAI